MTKSTRETVSPRFSREIRVLSFWSMIAVVLCHSYNYTDLFLLPTTRLTEGMQAGPMIEFFFSNAIVKLSLSLESVLSRFSK